MGVVSVFPADKAALRARGAGSRDQVCEVVILPVVRIDRYEDKPAVRPVSRGLQSSKRRKRASRS
jgi:hypothetical protein